MRYGVIDVGSNSVRLMLSENGITDYKLVKTTRLAGSVINGNIDFSMAKNTVDAFCDFVKKAKKDGADKVYAFATAAVRNAANGREFAKIIEKESGVELQILSGGEEAEIGYVGALDGKDGCVVDIGGASTEIAAVSGGKKIYGKSVNVGAVSLTALCGEDRLKAEKIAQEKIEEFGNVPVGKVYGIGGTATSVASMLAKLKEYDPKITHGYVVFASKLKELKEKLYATPLEERRSIIGLQPERADIIQSGVCILFTLCRYLGIDKITVSERDNLEGFIALKTEKK